MNLDFKKFVYALVTSTTYGTWLPGDERGFVERSEQNIYGTSYQKDELKLKRYAKDRLESDPVLLNSQQAKSILAQWQKEAQKSNWYLFVVAIMSNHFHLVVESPDNTTKEDLLRTLKSRASFILNKTYGKQTWWTTSGSVRFSFDEQTLTTRINYVRNQANPLILWENPKPY